MIFFFSERHVLNTEVRDRQTEKERKTQKERQTNRDRDRNGLTDKNRFKVRDKKRQIG